MVTKKRVNVEKFTSVDEAYEIAEEKLHAAVAEALQRCGFARFEVDEADLEGPYQEFMAAASRKVLRDGILKAVSDEKELVRT
jgi:hypothetical protein